MSMQIAWQACKTVYTTTAGNTQNRTVLCAGAVVVTLLAVYMAYYMERDFYTKYEKQTRDADLQLEKHRLDRDKFEHQKVSDIRKQEHEVKKTRHQHLMDERKQELDEVKESHKYEMDGARLMLDGRRIESEERRHWERLDTERNLKYMDMKIKYMDKRFELDKQKIQSLLQTTKLQPGGLDISVPNPLSLLPIGAAGKSLLDLKIKWSGEKIETTLENMVKNPHLYRELMSNKFTGIDDDFIGSDDAKDHD